MKKVIAFFLSFIFIFASFSGCSKIKSIGNKKITMEQLLSANDVDTLIDLYGSIKVSQTDSFSSSVEHYFRKNNRTVSAFKSIDNTGFESYSGCYGAYNFYFENDHYICFDDVESHKNPTEFIFKTSISSLFVEGKISNITDNGETYSFSITDPVKFDSGFYTVNKDTLAIQKCNVSSEDSEFSVNIAYGEEPEDFGLFDKWENPTKTVTVIKDESCFRRYEDSTDNTLTVKVPSDLEYIPTYDYDTVNYIDSDCSAFYQYPGNGIDYTIYVVKIIDA